MTEIDNTPDIAVLKFADSKIPEFKEVRNKDYILYGANNLYPEYLTYLYNKSAKHGAIINGKCNYVFGNGLKRQSNSSEASPIVNRAGESLDDTVKKSVKDVEIYGGYRWFIVWDVVGRISDMMHADFYKFRKAKDGGYFYKEDWSDSKEEAIFYPEFNEGDRRGVQVFAYNEYRPGCKEYPLPGYLACNNYIETDIEISKYNLSAITNGMMPSKLIQIYTGGENVSDEKKKDRERKWNNKFTGSEAGGKVIMAWCSSKEKNIEITDLSATESDKLFDLLNKTCQQEIFTGHGVVSPMLFGIKTEGQLGGTTELKIAHEIFINTYAKGKQQDFEKIVNLFDKLKGGLGDYYFEQVDPIGFQIDMASVLDQLPKRFIFEKLNIPKEYWNEAEVIEPGTELATSKEVNDNIKNLTGKQYQQVTRIIREYSKGKLTIEAAKTLLKSGYGLNDDYINSLLGVTEEQEFSAELDEDGIIGLFENSGSLKDEFHLIKSKAVKFESDEDALNDELSFHSQSFAETDINDADILRLIAKDKRITPEVIADVLSTDPEVIVKKIASLTKRGLIESRQVSIGEDIEIQRTLTKPLTEIVKDLGGDPPRTEILIKYSYEGPKDDRNRPFCKKMIELSRFYSRYEIELISQRLGYSVFDRRGGFWRKPDGTISASCRHNWKSNIVVRKGDKK